VAEACAARALGAPETYPRKEAKAERPRRRGVAYVLTRGNAVGLVRRPDKGLLGGMLALPSSDWGERPAALAGAPADVRWRSVGSIEHVFTHFALTLEVMRAEGEADDLIWTPVEEAARALPSVFLKALRQGLNGLL
jgi:A/G-specific adenine glycosylase